MAKRKSTESKEGSKNNQQNLTIIAVTAVVALVGAAIAIFVSSNDLGSTSGIDYDSIPQERLADGGFVLGEPDAPITIIEFADFLCPACQSYKPTVDRVIEELVMTGQARFEYRFFPTQGPNAEFAAQVAECSEEQGEGNFWYAHDELFVIASSRGASLGDDSGQELADRMDLNYAELLECTRDAEQYIVDVNLARRTGVQGSPGVRIRYGDSAPQTLPGYERGGIPFEVLQATVVQASLGVGQ